jgi:hypothetical protein
MNSSTLLNNPYLLSITEWLDSPKYCGKLFASPTYSNWKSLIYGFYGEVDHYDQKIFSTLTRRLLDSDFRELWVVGGRRSGKSHLASALAVYEAFIAGHQYKLSKGEVATVSLIASDRRQARTLMRYIKGIIDTIPALKRYIKKETAEIIELTNGCAIEIQTASYRGVRGYTLACAILDEVAFWYDDGANPDKEILKAIKPSLNTLNGKLICLSSPYSKRGILWDAYNRYFSKSGTPVLVAKCPTPFMNPTISKELLQQAEDEDAIGFKSEYLAEFRADIDSYVSESVINECTRSNPEILPYQREYTYKAFIDASGGRVDSYTCAIGHMEKDVVVIDRVESIKPPFSPEEATAYLAEIIKSYNCYRVTGDRYAGNWVRNAYERNGIDYKVSEKVTSELYLDFIPVLNSQKVELPPNEILRRELLSLERRSSRGGRLIISHPPNAHDDLANSCAGLSSTFLNRNIAIPNLKNIFYY